MLLAIAFYQATIGPLLGGACKYHPSCSCYAREAVERYRWRGVPMALGRLARCRPFHAGGWDPVPDELLEHTPASPFERIASTVVRLAARDREEKPSRRRSP